MAINDEACKTVSVKNTFSSASLPYFYRQPILVAVYFDLTIMLIIIRTYSKIARGVVSFLLCITNRANHRAFSEWVTLVNGITKLI